MQFSSQPHLYQKTQFFSKKPALRLLIIGFLLITAFGIRVYHINKPSLDFHSTRQYHSALVARGYYFETLKSIPEWRKEVARIYMQRTPKNEPRIMEHAAVFAYRIVGREQLWIPRLLSSIFWLIGGAFLYLTAKKIASPGAALFSFAFYLFVPFGISASRSFQPNPLMVMLLLLSIFLILRHYEQPSIFKLLVAATVSALAIFIRPHCLFLIFGAFISLAIYRQGMNRTGSYQGIRKAVISSNFLIFAVVSLLPSLIYYLNGIFIARFLNDAARTVIVPDLLLHPFFWKGWLTMIGRVVGYIAFIGAIIGFFMFRYGFSKALLIGLWIGYFVYGSVLAYPIYTHDYYHLQLIPIVAFSLGPIGAKMINCLTNQRWLVAILSIFLLTGALIIGLNKSQVQWGDISKGYRDQLKVLGAIIGVNPQFNEFLFRGFEREVRIAQEIGEIVGHSINTVYLDPQTGRALKYYGEFSGFQWPTTVLIQRKRNLWQMGEFNIEECLNFKIINGIAVFCPSYIGKYLKDIPEYFIVTDIQDFEEQADLRGFLFRNFSIVVQNDDYLIFDLRKISDSDKQLEKQ